MVGRRKLLLSLGTVIAAIALAMAAMPAPFAGPTIVNADCITTPCLPPPPVEAVNAHLQPNFSATNALNGLQGTHIPPQAPESPPQPLVVIAIIAVLIGMLTPTN
jgi:hypothetical protein